MSKKDHQFWVTAGERAGVGTVVAYLEQRAADLFLEGRDNEARAMRILSKEVAALKPPEPTAK